MAGAFYLFSVLTAVVGESLLRGTLALGAGLIAVSGMVAMTLLLYYIFEPVNRSLSLLAAFFSLVGLTFEALRLNPRGADIAVAIHGFYCLLIGYLIFRSRFLPRILGALMAVGGLGWLTNLSTPFAHYLSPDNLAAGFLGVGSVMLWLLVMGVNAQRWTAQASAAAVRA
jgi:hypothetical protein